MFKGSMVALVTPFKNGRVDKVALRSLIELHIKSGTDAIVVCGTTGESATLSMDEHKLVISFSVLASNGRVPVIAGAGSNNTRESLELVKHAVVSGADGILAVTPYYNKPNQQGLYEHYKALAEASKLPIILYNVPGRTACNLQPTTVAKLAKLTNIVAIKEASGNLEAVSEILTLVPRFTVLSGDDALTMPMMALGAQGAISVTANVVPERMKAMIQACLDGNWKEAKRQHYNLFSLSKAMFIDTNPIPVKAALKAMNHITGDLRLPLTPLKGEPLKALKAVLQLYKVK